ncbi:MAG: DUF1549 domain-containing protein, partial [Kiritimatiellae bacterium]|nr:DUF1549 domain-containing protein [Kiritimatiellia bacterium]
MAMRFSRRAFLGGAAALAVWPGDVWGAAKKRGGKPSVSQTSVWENPDGMATDCVMVRRMCLDIAGRIPTEREARDYLQSNDPAKRETLVMKLLESKDFV